MKLILLINFALIVAAISASSVVTSVPDLARPSCPCLCSVAAATCPVGCTSLPCKDGANSGTTCCDLQELSRVKDAEELSDNDTLTAPQLSRVDDPDVKERKDEVVDRHVSHMDDISPAEMKVQIVEPVAVKVELKGKVVRHGRRCMRCYRRVRCVCHCSKCFCFRYIRRCWVYWC